MERLKEGTQKLLLWPNQVGWNKGIGIYGGEEKCIQCLCGEIERKRLLGKPKWEDYIKINIKFGVWGHGLDLSGWGPEQVTGCWECSNE